MRLIVLPRLLSFVYFSGTEKKNRKGKYSMMVGSTYCCTFLLFQFSVHGVFYEEGRRDARLEDKCLKKIYASKLCLKCIKTIFLLPANIRCLSHSRTLFYHDLFGLNHVDPCTHTQLLLILKESRTKFHVG